MANVDRKIGVSIGYVGGPGLSVAMTFIPDWMHSNAILTSTLFCVGIALYLASILHTGWITWNEKVGKKLSLSTFLIIIGGAFIIIGATLKFFPNKSNTGISNTKPQQQAIASAAIDGSKPSDPDTFFRKDRDKRLAAVGEILQLYMYKYDDVVDAVNACIPVSLLQSKIPEKVLQCLDTSSDQVNQLINEEKETMKSMIYAKEFSRSTLDWTESIRDLEMFTAFTHILVSNLRNTPDAIISSAYPLHYMEWKRSFDGAKQFINSRRAELELRATYLKKASLFD